MAQSEWQRRIKRAEELGAQHRFATEMLRFYASVARCQEKLYGTFRKIGTAAVAEDAFALALPPEVVGHFGELLSVVEQNGPEAMRESAREWRGGGDSGMELLQAYWAEQNSGGLPAGADDFFARAFLQPYAVAMRERSNLKWSGPAPYRCPFCKRKPGVGVLRPLGDGGQRSLVCSLCLAEWEFRRIVCVGCGEEDYAKLPVYTAEDLPHVRVEACESCRTYIKTVDMTKAGRAEPIVDEMAAIPLDVWAEKQGYGKLQLNVLQM